MVACALSLQLGVRSGLRHSAQNASAKQTTVRRQLSFTMQNTLTLHRPAACATKPVAPRASRQPQFQGAPEQPNGRTFIGLLTAFRESGGTAPGDVVARLLAEYQCSKIETLASLVAQKRGFNFEWRGCCWFPMFQFELSDWSLKSGPHQVCETLPRESSGWTIAIWFASPNLRLRGQTPADMLETDLGGA